ncbi:MAG: NADP-dependent oxidoreductase [Burkholderiaceae bacterium]|nr:MAG: NADP-dependent oxidoreductase [Burkholderiaceae bacterium]TAM05298.1 MAG: NADP-dependent oxidoreductase [Pusillimonas sp.]
MNKETKNAEIRLVRRPGKHLDPLDFSEVATSVEDPKAGQVLIKVLWLSMDTYLYERTVEDVMGPKVALNTRMVGRGVGIVMAGSMAPGTVVSGEFGWQKYATVNESAIAPVSHADVPKTWHLSVLGAPGLTAWTALHKVLRLTAGKTLLVSGAAGTVGSIVAQLGVEAGLHVIGIAGGPEKCRALMQLGLQATIDRKSVGDWKQAITAAAPKGIDFYYDNAGGKILEAVVQVINARGHIVLCGHNSEYTSGKTAQITATDVLYKGLTVHGFRQFDHREEFAEGRADLVRLLQQKKLRINENIHEGLASAPSALRDMLEGNGFGKHLVKVQDE